MITTSRRQAKRPNTDKRSDRTPQETKFLASIFTRYIILLILGVGDLYIIYKILTPATIHTVNTILSIFTETTLIKNIILLKEITIEIVPACIAGAAFYLLLILILSTPNIKPKTRTKAIITAILLLFALNVTRILILIQLSNLASFEIIHWIFWHLISIAFVVGIWFSVVKFYKIKSIPIYSDITYIKNLINPTKNPKRKKKNN